MSSGSPDRPRDGDPAEASAYVWDPADGELAETARRGAREWERDMALWEGDAEQLRRKRRPLIQVLWEAMQRGDRTTIAVGGHVFTGSLSAARRDLALLDTAELKVGVNVTGVETVTFEPGGPGVVGERVYGSLRAYLGMLEVERPPVRIVGTHVDVSGRVEVVAADHVVLRGHDGGSWAVPSTAIGAVITGVRDHPAP